MTPNSHQKNFQQSKRCVKFQFFICSIFLHNNNSDEKNEINLVFPVNFSYHLILKMSKFLLPFRPQGSNQIFCATQIFFAYSISCICLFVRVPSSSWSRAWICQLDQNNSQLSSSCTSLHNIKYNYNKEFRMKLN